MSRPTSHLKEPCEADGRRAVIVPLSVGVDDLTQSLDIRPPRLGALTTKIFRNQLKNIYTVLTSGLNVGARYQESSLRLTSHCSSLLFFLARFWRPLCNDKLSSALQ